ncbi:MAG TPA: hypothetical protein VEX60_05310 [Pyrinomonadaceae bacterium]|nr:hypothetical protein [Pyrinomonadaceae bacterium]
MREEVWTAAWVELVNLLRVAAWDARNAIERLQEKKVIDKSLHMMRKGQVKRLDGRDAVGQARFVESLFGVAA